MKRHAEMSGRGRNVECGMEDGKAEQLPNLYLRFSIFRLPSSLIPLSVIPLPLIPLPLIPLTDIPLTDPW